MGTQRRVRALLVVPWGLATALFAVGCGGGGGGSAALPPTLGSSAPSSAPIAPASVSFSVEIPAASPSATVRQPRYVSAGTKSAVIGYNGTRQIVNCTTTCAATLQVPSGQETFTAALYDGPNGMGHVLAQGQTVAQIAAGQVNNVQITFDGLVASVAVALGSASITAGTPATIPVIVTAKDAAGYTIVGSAPFSSPITLNDDDSSGATTLSTTSLASPGGATLSYNGSGDGGVVNVSASISGASISAAPASLTIAGKAKGKATPAPVSTALPTTAPTAVPAPLPTATPTIAPTVSPVPASSGTVLWKLGDPTLGQYVLPQASDGQCGTQSISGATVSFLMSENGTACYRDQINPEVNGNNQILTDGQQYTWTFHYIDGSASDAAPGMGYDQDARSLLWQIHAYNGSNVCTALGFDNGGTIGAPQQWNFANSCTGLINWRGTYTPGEQDDWEIQALISSTSAGWVKLYRNGTLVYSGTGPNYSGGTGGPWWNFGPYKWRWELQSGIGDLGNVTTMSTVGATFSNMVLTTP